MSSKKCPNCDLYNIESALRCDCGFDFPSGQITDSYLTYAEKMNTENKKAKEISRHGIKEGVMKQKHSVLGIASFVICIIVLIEMILLGLTYSLAYFIDKHWNPSIYQFCLPNIFLSISALVLAVLGQVRQNRKKIFVYIGIAFSLFLLILLAILYAYGKTILLFIWKGNSVY